MVAGAPRLGDEVVVRAHDGDGGHEPGPLLHHQPEELVVGRFIREFGQAHGDQMIDLVGSVADHLDGVGRTVYVGHHP